MNRHSPSRHIILPDNNRQYWVIAVPHGCDLPVETFSVAVVGNAQSLFETESGTEIDSHDVVIRMNRAAQLMDISPDYEPSHGTRTDIWCMWRHREYENVDIAEPNSVCQMMWWDETPESGVHQIHTGWFSGRMSPWTPSTGMMTLAWLSTLPCTVSVYGFDWKATPTYTDPHRQHDQTSIHNFELEREICEQYFQASGRYRFCN